MGVAVLCAVALAAEPLGAVDRGEEDATRPNGEVREVPEPLRSEGGDADLVPEPPMGDFSSSPLMGGVPERFADADPVEVFARRGERVEELTSATTEVVRHPDGTFTADVAAGAVRFRAADGGWVDYDARLVRAGEADAARVAAVQDDVLAVAPGDLVARASDVPAVLVTDGGAVTARLATTAGAFALGVPDAAGRLDRKDRRVMAEPGREIVDVGTARAGVDVRLGLVKRGVEQSLVLASAAAAVSSYEVAVETPVGVTARAGGAGVEFVDAAGVVVAVFAGGVAFEPERRATTPVEVRLVGVEAGRARVGVSIDAGWLAAPGRRFPVVIDPWLLADPIPGSDGDTYVNNVHPNSNYSAAQFLHSGAFGGGEVDRTYMKFSGLPAPNVVNTTWVGVAALQVEVTGGQSSAPKVLKVNETLPFTPSTMTWNSGQPGFGPELAASWVATGTNFFDVTTPLNERLRNGGGSTTIYLGVLADDEGAGSASGKHILSSEAWVPPRLKIYYTHLASQVAAPRLPAHDATVGTLTPQLSTGLASEIDPGEEPQYWFTVATGSNGLSGMQVWNSGWVTAPSVTVPAGHLQDGAVYYWTVWTFDGVMWTTPDWSQRLRVNQRLGASGPSPFDAVGPVSVNLATGNVHVAAASPSFATVGGGVGLTYTYNSQQRSSAGLRGQYFANPTLAGEPSVVRTDPTMWFQFDGSAPPPQGVPTQNWSARWSGYLTVPAPESVGGTPGQTSWKLATSHHAGVRVWVGGTQVYNNWGVNSWTTWHDSAAFTMTPGTPAPITVELWNDSGIGALDLRVRPVGVAHTAVSPLGGGWISTDAPGLPTGWSVSADLDGEIPYVRLAQVGEAVALTASDGSVDRWVKTPTGGWKPEGAASGQVSAKPCPGADCGRFEYLGGGVIEVFNADGTLAWVRSQVDARKPAAATFEWSAPATNLPARLVRVSDPVSGKDLELVYSGGGTCPTAAGYDANPPAGMLCKVDYSDFASGSTELLYAGGRLAAIKDPGAEWTSFGYTDGRLSRVTDPAATDASLAGLVPAGDQIATMISYDGDGRAISVQGPEPAPVAGSPNVNSRPLHTYEYATTTTVVKQRYPGTPPTMQTLRTVEYDTDKRVTSDTDATGKTTTTQWTVFDAVAATIDPAGMKTTTIYEASTTGDQHPDWQLPLETYGPANKDWFTAAGGLKPGALYENSTPKATTRYDTNRFGSASWTGLSASWWDNPNLAGAPKHHSHWEAGGGANAVQDWGTGTPGGPIGADNWSVQLTGDIRIAAGTGANRWEYQLSVDDAATLMIDDHVIASNWDGPYPGTISGTVPFDVANQSWHKIRIVMREFAGGARIKLERRNTAGGAWSLVPMADLAPRFDLVTWTKDPDGRVSATEYEQSSAFGPELGLATIQIQDPAGLNLRTKTYFEAPSSTTFLRRTGRQLPRQVATSGGLTTSYEYYQPTQSRTFPTPAQSHADCPDGSANQGGLLQRETDADPPGADDALVRETIYDEAHRPVFTREEDDATWSCTVYDARGRATKSITDGRIISTDYSTPGVVISTFVDSSNTQRTVEAHTNLLGQTVRYRDEHGAWFRTVYDVAGRVVETWRKLAWEGTETKITSTGHDVAGRVMASTEHVSLSTGRTTTLGYDTHGRLTTATRPTDVAVTTTTSYSPDNGRVAQLATRRAGTPPTDVWINGYAYSLGGRVTADWNTAMLRTYDYDMAGRLTKAQDFFGGSGTRDYAYDENGNRCANATTCASPTFAYDVADRITASPYGSGYSYDGHGNLASYTKSGGGTVSFTYDAYDHATTIDDGTTRVVETLAPDGRVLRRVVTSPPGGTVIEDTIFGYDGADDSPAYSLDMTLTVTTFLGAITIRGATPTYHVANSHGDHVGNVDQAGTFTAEPVTDEYGVGTTSADRLGWLGQHQRFTTHTALGIIRMGVRLYDPRLGRFHGVDPVEGGSCNDYDYVCADPINAYDLDGRWGWSNVTRWAKDRARDVRRVSARVGRTVWRYRDEIALGLAVVGSFACAVCTVAFYGGIALAGASTAVSCARGSRASCAVGVASLVTGGAGRGLARAGSMMRSAGRARMAASRWHPIRRGITGPLLGRTGRAASKAGFRLSWASNGLSAYGLRY